MPCRCAQRHYSSGLTTVTPAPFTPSSPTQVLAALQLLVNVLGPESTAAYPLLVPLLRHALDPASRWAAGGSSSAPAL